MSKQFFLEMKIQKQTITIMITKLLPEDNGRIQMIVLKDGYCFAATCGLMQQGLDVISIIYLFNYEFMTK